MPRLLALLGSIALAASAEAASPSSQDRPASRGETRQNPAFVQEADGWSASAPGWHARLTTAGLTFEARSADGEHGGESLVFQLDSVRLGDGAGPELELAVAPELKGDRITYRRSQTVRETYELFPDGVKQSFVFDSLPPGRGDLEVTGRLDGPPPSSPAGERLPALDFATDGTSALRIDGIIGIDARGERTEGSARFLDGAVTFTLPAEFVATAELPLILDPLYGFAGQLDTLQPRGRSDEVNGNFGNESVVAYETTFSDGSTGISYGTFQDSSGFQEVGPKGLPGLLNVSSTNPTLGYSDGNERIVAAWQVGDEVWATSMSQSTLEISQTLVLGAGRSPDATTNSAPGDDRALIVREHGGAILLTAITTSSGTALEVLWDKPLVESGPNARPVLSRWGGAPNHYLVVWESAGDPSAGREPGLEAVAVDIDGNPLSPVLRWTDGGGVLRMADADGDAGESEWTVAYVRENAAEGSGAPRRLIRATRLRLQDGALALGPHPPRTLLDAGLQQIHALGIAKIDQRAVVSWSVGDDDPATADGAVGWLSINPDDCSLCEVPVAVASNLRGTPRSNIVAYEPAGVSPVPGWASGAFHWSYSQGALDNTVSFVQRYRFAGFNNWVRELGGGCGTPGKISIDGSVALGSTSLEAQLDLVPFSADLAVLNVTGSPAVLDCNECVWAPFATTFIAPLVPASIGKSAVQPLSIPCRPELEGLAYQFQWTVIGSPASPCETAPNISISDRLELVLRY